MKAYFECRLQYFKQHALFRVQHSTRVDVFITQKEDEVSAIPTAFCVGVGFLAVAFGGLDIVWTLVVLHYSPRR